MKENHCQPRIIYTVKYLSKIKVKKFTQKLKEFISCRSVLKEMLKEGFQPEEYDPRQKFVSIQKNKKHRKL